MNGLDYLILALIAIGALYGTSRGVLRIGSSLVAVIAGVYFASIYDARVGGYFTRAFSAKPEVGAVLGYVVILLAVMVVVAWGGGKVADLIRAVHMSWLDRLAGGVVGVVSVQALDAVRRPGHTASRRMRDILGEGCIPLVGIPGVGGGQCRRELRIGTPAPIHRTHPTGGFEPPDPGHRQRATQPVAGREGSSVIQHGGHDRHHGETEGTPCRDRRLGSEGATDLSLEIGPVRHPPTRSRPVMKFQMRVTIDTLSP